MINSIKAKLISISLLLIFTFPSFAQNKFRINLSNYKSSNLTGSCLFFFSRVYKKVGLELETVSLPRKRAIRYLNTGKIDADCAASENLDNNYSNIHPIKIPLAILRYKVLGLKSSKQVYSVSQLHKSRVGALTLSTYLQSLYKHRNKLMFVEDLDQLILLLKRDRIDYILFQDSEFTNRFDKKVFEVKSEVLFQTKAFHYINKKHLPIFDKIKSAIIETLKEKDVIEYFRKRRLNNQ